MRRRRRRLARAEREPVAPVVGEDTWQTHLAACQGIVDHDPCFRRKPIGCGARAGRPVVLVRRALRWKPLRPLHIAASLLIAATGGSTSRSSASGSTSSRRSPSRRGASCWARCRYCAAAAGDLVEGAGRHRRLPVRRPVRVPVLRHGGRPAARPVLRAGPIAGPAHPGAGRAVPARARHGGQWAGLGVAMIGVILIAPVGRRQRQPVRRRHRPAVGAELGRRQSLPARDARRVGARPVTAWASSFRRCRSCSRACCTTAGRDAGADPGAHLAGLVRAFLHGRTGDVAGLPAVGHAAAHLSGRQGRAGLAAGAVLRPGLFRPAHRRGGRGLAAGRIAVVLGGVALGIFTSGRR